MNISIVSPYLNNTGKTVIASLISLALANTDKTVCLTSSSLQSKDIANYFTLDEISDITAGFGRMLSLIRDKALSSNDAPDYTKSITNKLDVFNSIEKLDDTDLQPIREFVLNEFKYNFNIIDVDTDFESECTKQVIEKSDLVICVLTPQRQNLETFSKNKEKINRIFKNKHCLILFNKYDKEIHNFKDIAKYLGIKKNGQWLTFRDNKWISYSTDHNMIEKLYDFVKKQELPQLTIGVDLNSLISNINRANKTIHRK